MATTEAESCWEVGKKVCEPLVLFCPYLSQNKIIYYFMIIIFLSVVFLNFSNNKICKYNSYSSVTVDYCYCLVDGYPTRNTPCTYSFHTVEYDSMQGLSGFLHSGFITVGAPK